jgi:hypothetical protein
MQYVTAYARACSSRLSKLIDSVVLDRQCGVMWGGHGGLRNNKTLPKFSNPFGDPTHPHCVRRFLLRALRMVLTAS